MTDFDVQSIAIEAPAGRAFDFIADPRNLPKWTHAFKEADRSSATMQTPQGSVRIGLAVSPCGVRATRPTAGAWWVRRARWGPRASCGVCPPPRVQG